MNHYDSETWSLYRENKIDEERRLLMEEHLALCDRCLHRYLAGATDEEARLAELMLPPEFCAAVQENIGKRKVLLLKRKRSRSLINYTVAAAITLVLMSSGIFDLCAREIPGLLRETEQITLVLEKKRTHWDSGALLESARTGFKKLRGHKEE